MGRITFWRCLKMINEAKLRGYIRLVESGRRQLSEVPEPYRTEAEKVLNEQ